MMGKVPANAVSIEAIPVGPHQSDQIGSDQQLP